MPVLLVEHQCRNTGGNNVGGGGGGAGGSPGGDGINSSGNLGSGGGQGIAIPSTFRSPTNPYGREGRPGQPSITGGFYFAGGGGGASGPGRPNATSGDGGSAHPGDTKEETNLTIQEQVMVKMAITPQTKVPL